MPFAVEKQIAEQLNSSKIFSKDVTKIIACYATLTLSMTAEEANEVYFVTKKLNEYLEEIARESYCGYDPKERWFEKFSSYVEGETPVLDSIDSIEKEKFENIKYVRTKAMKYFRKIESKKLESFFKSSDNDDADTYYPSSLLPLKYFKIQLQLGYTLDDESTTVWPQPKSVTISREKDRMFSWHHLFQIIQRECVPNVPDSEIAQISKIGIEYDFIDHKFLVKIKLLTDLLKMDY